MKQFNTDFYQYLPKYLQTNLDEKITLYENTSWFEQAWNDYRKHVISVPRNHMQSPNLFFQKYIEENNEEDILSDVVENELFSNDELENELFLDDTVTDDVVVDDIFIETDEEESNENEETIREDDDIFTN